MGGKRKITKVLKPNIALRGKGGFTLAELCIVLAIVVIASAMIVSFSVSMNDFIESNQEEYDFLEDCAIVREELCKWIAEQDSQDQDFSNMPTVSKGTLDLGDRKIEDLNTIKEIDFVFQGNLVQCNITRVGSQSPDKSFVFALRCANAQGGDTNE